MTKLLLSARVSRYMKIHMNEWVSIKDISYYARIGASHTGLILKSLDMDISQKKEYNDSYYRYNVLEPMVPDYYEQIIFRYESEVKIHPNVKSIARQCLNLCYPATLIQLEPSVILTLSINQQIMNPQTTATKKTYINGIRMFVDWLRTKQTGYPEWFKPELDFAETVNPMFVPEVI